MHFSASRLVLKFSLLTLIVLSDMLLDADLGACCSVSAHVSNTRRHSFKMGISRTGDLS